MIKPDSGIPNDFLFLEDLSGGQRFISRKYELTESDIKAFARQFDPQPGTVIDRLNVGQNSFADEANR